MTIKITINYPIEYLPVKMFTFDYLLWSQIDFKIVTEFTKDVFHTYKFDQFLKSKILSFIILTVTFLAFSNRKSPTFLSTRVKIIF